MAIAGTDIIYDAAFKQAGVLRVDSVEELFDVASALLRQPLPKGNRVGIITSGGGFGCVISDACERLGLKVEALSRETIEKLIKSSQTAGLMLIPWTPWLPVLST